MSPKRLAIGGVLAGVFAAAAAAVGTATGGAPAPPPGHLSVTAVSTHADRVSGGDVLIEIATPGAAGASARPPAVTLGGRDVSAAFHRAENGVHLGLVTGLTIGKNTLKIQGAPWGVADASLELTNYPSTGPIVSGPPLQPFACQTETFKLPDGSVIGKPLDADCSFPTRIEYVYLPAGGTRAQADGRQRSSSSRRGHHDDPDWSGGAVCRAGRNRRDESRRLPERHPARPDEGSGADAVFAAARLESPAHRAARIAVARADGTGPAGSWV